MKRKISYDIARVGRVNIDFYKEPLALANIMEDVGIVRLLKASPQLGPSSSIYTSLNTSRWDYLMVLLSIITKMCTLSGRVGRFISVQSRFKCGGKKFDFSNGEALMLAFMISSCGHNPSTFSGHRVVLDTLKRSENRKEGVRHYLPNCLKPELDKLIDRQDYYNYNKIHSIYKLSCYDIESCELEKYACIMSWVLNHGEGNQALYELYRSVRRTAYLGLDSTNAYVPISVDLSALFLLNKSNFVDVMQPGSLFQKSLVDVEALLADMLYISPYSIYCHWECSKHVRRKLAKAAKKKPRKDHFRSILCKDKYDVFSTTGIRFLERHDIHKHASFSICPTVGSSTIEFEKTIQSKVRDKRLIVGAQSTHDLKEVRVALMSNVSESDLPSVELFDAYSRAIDSIAKCAEEPGFEVTSDAYKAMVKGLLEILFPTYLVELDDIEGHDCIIVARGSGEAHSRVRAVVLNLNLVESISADVLNEAALVEAALGLNHNSNSNNSRAFIYLGSVSFFTRTNYRVDESIGGQDHEVDGVVYYPSQHKLLFFEAKNTRNARSKARKQLVETLETITGLDANELDLQCIVDEGKGCWATVDTVKILEKLT